MTQIVTYPTISVVGAILPADVVTRAMTRDLPDLTPATYGLPSGYTLNQAAARAWELLLPTYNDVQKRIALLSDKDPATTLTREKWTGVLLRELGYTPVPVPGGITVDDDTFDVHLVHSHVPIHLLGWNVDLDQRASTNIRGASRSAPHSLIQELLNRSEDHLWAILSNGRRLRLLRDNVAMGRPAYLEFDLETMFGDQQYADFAALFTLAHASRLTSDTPADVILEKWRAVAIADGTRALDGLRAGVTNALTTLGTSFLEHPDNRALRDLLADNHGATTDYHRWLLRLVYRMIFLFVAEDRHLLHPPGTPAHVQSRYVTYFSTARVRHLATRRRAGRHTDLWDQQKLVFTALGADGDQSLGLPGYGSLLFSPGGVGLLSTLQLSNDRWLDAIRSLSQIPDKTSGALRPVDYRHLGSEELGSVYEGLLEYVPTVEVDHRTFTLETLAGNARKTSGSYYTPSSLVDLTLDTALEPLLDEAAASDNPEHALLSLTICDPACGSGHFLVAAGRRIARRLASVRTGDLEPAPEHTATALRDVVARCLYGVDMNDLAAELAKISLWLEGMTPGAPLAFLDAHIKVGNALLGATPRLLAGNIPNDAFQVPTAKLLPGDDPTLLKAAQKRNAVERKTIDRGELPLFLSPDVRVATKVLSEEAVASELETGEASAEQIRAQADAWRRWDSSPELSSARLIADTWCAAWVWSHTAGMPPAPTAETLLFLQQDPAQVSLEIRDTVARVARQFRFFHWHLEFPQIFTTPADPATATSPHGWSGGFTCVLGNPPWENYRPLDTEFFAAAGRDDIVNARTSAIREQLIEALQESDPALYAVYWAAQRQFSGTVRLLGQTGRFPLTGTGNLTTHDLFAEHCRDVTAPHGSSGILVPTAVMTGSQTAPFVADLIERQQISGFYDFVNSGNLFPGVHSSYRFGVLGVTGPERSTAHVPLAFHLTDPKQIGPDTLIVLTSTDLARINPNTKNLPVFSSPLDARITASIHRAHPVLRSLDAEAGNPWRVTTGGLFDMTHEAHLFVSPADLEAQGADLDGSTWRTNAGRWLPLYEGKHVWLYDHRFATGQGATLDKVRDTTPAEHDSPNTEIVTRHYVAELDVDRKLAHRTNRPWLMGWRDIARATDQRTLIPALLPRSAVGNSLPMIYLDRASDSLCFLAALSSLPCDYVLRQKSSGAHVSKFMLNQVPMPHPKTFAAPCPWNSEQSLTEWVTPLVIELTYTSWSLQQWAGDVGDEGNPYRWDPTRRALLQAELDAAMFHVYGLDKDQTRYILKSFRALRDAETRQVGEYRTERLVLAAYDQIGMAVRNGNTFKSSLQPTPGHGPRHHVAT